MSSAAQSSTSPAGLVSPSLLSSETYEISEEGYNLQRCLINLKYFLMTISQYMADKDPNQDIFQKLFPILDPSEKGSLAWGMIRNDFRALCSFQSEVLDRLRFHADADSAANGSSLLDKLFLVREEQPPLPEELVKAIMNVHEYCILVNRYISGQVSLCDDACIRTWIEAVSTYVSQQENSSRDNHTACQRWLEPHLNARTSQAYSILEVLSRGNTSSTFNPPWANTITGRAGHSSLSVEADATMQTNVCTRPSMSLEEEAGSLKNYAETTIRAVEQIQEEFPWLQLVPPLGNSNGSDCDSICNEAELLPESDCDSDGHNEGITIVDENSLPSSP